MNLIETRDNLLQGAEKSNSSIRNYEQSDNNDGQQSPDFLLPDNKSLMERDLYLSFTDDSDLDPIFSPTDTSSCESDDELYIQKGAKDYKNPKRRKRQIETISHEALNGSFEMESNHGENIEIGELTEGNPVVNTVSSTSSNHDSLLGLPKKRSVSGNYIYFKVRLLNSNQY
ncbi:unnamed protein product [Diabrotica balteata]|uniref:Uncharacterized protein n=1 Tax=Diabrotica balteata TaxID=107213 RepID=A0A9N9SVQ7_DIABA|nr:unnamed protein product [Diabrotica balteata]